MNLLAQLTNPALPPGLGGGLSADIAKGPTALGGLIAALIGLILIIAFLLAFFTLITGGIQWITSSGDKAGLESARDKITHALLGLIIVAATWSIMILVGNFLGINLSTNRDTFRLPIPSFSGESLPPNSNLDLPLAPPGQRGGPF